MTSIIFDLDGTLVDSAPLIASILNEMRPERAVTAAEARKYLTQGGAQIVAELLQSDDIDADLATFRLLYRSRPTQPDCLFPGVRDGLQSLFDAGVLMAICSNKPLELCHKILNDLDLDHFTTIAGSVDGSPLKPDPHLARQACVGLGPNPLYVGDSKVDYETAAVTGIPFAFVTWGYAEEGFSFDGQRFDHFEDLVQFALQPAAA